MNCRERLTRHFFQQLLVNIKVRVDVLHIVLILQSFHKPNHGVGGLPFQLDVVLRNHGDAG